MWTAAVSGGGLLTYIDNSRSQSIITGSKQAWEIGAALGRFHQLAASLPADALADPLPGLHNTPLYLAQYDALLSTALNPEAEDCRECIDRRRFDVFLLENARKQGRIRQQVIHGDPKVANFLFAAGTNQVISLIDLDTVKPGLLLHDIGDCIRSCCNPLGEEIENPDDIIFNPELFAAVRDG